MVVEKQQAGLLQARACGEELGEDILAAAVLFEHLTQAPDLSLDSGQAILELLAIVPFQCGRHVY